MIAAVWKENEDGENVERQVAADAVDETVVVAAAAMA